MKHTKRFILFLILSTSFASVFSQTIQNGTLDPRGQNFNGAQIMTISGRMGFYEHQIS